ncbi:hypothetical protein PF006_g11854 [Phytophthora fragariae]|uniref:Uncharacterized protein n=1 Tax=Phytophthora fragariae TaxID=53985 RepID=A0A6A3TXQ3_9STRA|nr:hypothetical protein PF009_g13170 [Phytophthora fragariae]KAE9143100.1 hypothetical protein PF006_g11854 [Phytophthora fragariae]
MYLDDRERRQREAEGGGPYSSSSDNENGYLGLSAFRDSQGNDAGGLEFVREVSGISGDASAILRCNLRRDGHHHGDGYDEPGRRLHAAAPQQLVLCVVVGLFLVALRVVPSDAAAVSTGLPPSADVHTEPQRELRAPVLHGLDSFTARSS